MLIAHHQFCCLWEIIVWARDVLFHSVGKSCNHCVGKGSAEYALLLLCYGSYAICPSLGIMESIV